MTNSKLKEIRDYLFSKKKDNQKLKFNFPSLWDYENEDLKIKLIKENPYSFYSKTLDFILKRKPTNLESIKPKDLKIYAAHLRSLTSFNHGNKLGNNDGTFLKTIILLPYLKKLGINTLYLLPIGKPSWHKLKGDLPCPYATTSFTELDPLLGDKLLNGEFTLNDQYGALVEACHKMGMKVVMDFVFRTVGRDHEWVFKNPEWFIWIPKALEGAFRAPTIKGLDPNNKEKIIQKQIWDENDIKCMFTDENTQRYLKHFMKPPMAMFDNKLKDLKSIEETFQITTVPAFSDWFNDPQPPWTDVTYLRMYLDHPILSKKYLSETQAPYLLYDVIHSDRIEGDLINTELWEKLANVIPYYQEKFGIDGARIDMAHSMPKTLMENILNRAKELNRNFIFMSEDFDMTPKVVKEKTKHFDIFLGNLWWNELPENLKNLPNILKTQVRELSMPVIATSETADTSRTAARTKDLSYIKSLYLLNSFLPNSVPLINGGFELMEVIALNGALAVGNDTKKKKETPKVGFFNHFEMDWLRKRSEKFLEFILNINELADKIKVKIKPEILNEPPKDVIIIKCDKHYLIANFSNKSLSAFKELKEFNLRTFVISSKEKYSKGLISSGEVALIKSI